MEYVLQPWVGQVGLKMQSILLSGLRAPDAPTIAVKKAIRWMREVSQINADPTKKSYMAGVVLDRVLADAAIDECEYLSCHFVHHFADAMAVIAYCHPDTEVQGQAYYVHLKVAEELFHFIPESRAQFFARHRDGGRQIREGGMTRPAVDHGGCAVGG